MNRFEITNDPRNSQVCDKKPKQENYIPDTLTNDSKAQTQNHAYISKDQFDFKKTIGRGTYGSVYLVESKLNGERYALKVLRKEHIQRYGKVEAVYRERDIALELSKHPYFVKFISSF